MQQALAAQEEKTLRQIKVLDAERSRKCLKLTRNFSSLCSPILKYLLPILSEKSVLASHKTVNHPFLLEKILKSFCFDDNERKKD